ncbi:C39 family peptidase [Desulfogranum japonicum]|uniref:C39 family peptidase n=1 Tax=Desulfogranum japonicum TaxID=231447 RepID=UPI000424DAB9|nr:C39 family peptidase [Desulfogranum japonicum]
MPGKQRSECDSPLLSPVSLALLTLIASPLAGGLACAMVFARLQKKIRAVVVATLSLLIMPPVYGLLIFQPIKWYWSSLVLMAVHICCTAIVYISMRRIYLADQEHFCIRFSPRRLQKKSYILAGMSGGMLFSLILGLACLSIYILANDHLFATLMPVAFNDAQALSLLLTCQLVLLLSGIIAGGYMGKIRLRISPLQTVGYAIALILIALTWFFFLQLTIALPSFQAGQASGRGWGADSAIFFAINLLIGSWWIPFLLHYYLRPESAAGKGFRLVQVLAINSCAAISLAIGFGAPTNWFSTAGKFFEQHGQVSKALWCYQHGLEKQPNQRIAGYLQFRAALLAHKLGDDQAAKHGFQKVVAQYNVNQELVKRSSRYLDNLEIDSSDLKRIVLPGVETPITFKDAYCVPNSLALVLNFWGAKLSATEIGHSITGLGRGTLTVDQAWYTDSLGFRNDFFPMATLQDIKNVIDAGMPALVYVPGHVFAIVGYDEQLKTLVTYDVATQDVWVDYFQEDFVKAWKKVNATLALVYPQGEASRVPASLRNKREKISDAYLHYHLHYLDSPDGFPSKEHLEIAQSLHPSFFLPYVALMEYFPKSLNKPQVQENEVKAINSITNFFAHGFDEGVHLWGQRHYEDYAESDQNFYASLTYLIYRNHLDDAKQVINQVEATGLISDETKGLRGMLDLANGNLPRGVERLESIYEPDLAIYQAAAQIAMEKSRAAVANLVRTVDSCTCHYQRDPVGPQESNISRFKRSQMLPSMYRRFRDRKYIVGFDQFGYPATYLANTLLLQQKEYGDNSKELEEAWTAWIHYNPFDFKVARQLSTLLQQRIADAPKGSKAVHQLERQLRIINKREQAYRELYTAGM